MCTASKTPLGEYSSTTIWWIKNSVEQDWAVFCVEDLASCRWTWQSATWKLTSEVQTRKKTDQLVFEWIFWTEDWTQQTHKFTPTPKKSIKNDLNEMKWTLNYQKEAMIHYCSFPVWTGCQKLNRIRDLIIFLSYFVSGLIYIRKSPLKRIFGVGDLAICWVPG